MNPPPKHTLHRAAPVAKSILASLLCLLAASRIPADDNTPQPGAPDSPQKILFTASTLVRLGIAPANLPPDDRSVDAGPLLEHALAWASGHSIPVVCIAKGNYYFSARPGTRAHLTMQSLKNVVLEGNGSTFHFASRDLSGIRVQDSSNIGVQHLSLDYDQDLPSTTAVIGSVDVASKTIHFSSVLGRRVSDLDNLNPKKSIRIFILRKDVHGTMTDVCERFLAAPGVKLQNDQVTLATALNDPDLLKTELQDMQSGDLVSISERNYTGANALEFTSHQPGLCTGNFAKEVSVYSAPAEGVAALWQNDTTFSKIKVRPAPDRIASQFISSNADGINNTNGSGYKLTDSSVRYTGDDGISLSTGSLGTVKSVTGGTRITVSEVRYPFYAGEIVSFSDPVTQKVLGTATVTSVSPVAGVSAQALVTMDQALPLAVPGAVVFMQLQDKTAKVLIQGNQVHGAYARGIFSSGIHNGTFTSNQIDATVGAGIAVLSSHEGLGFRSPGSTDMDVGWNSVLNAFGWGFNGMHGAIEVSISNAGKPTNEILNSNISVHDNTISYQSDSGEHCGIYITNTGGVHVENNKIKALKKGVAPVDLTGQDGIVIK